MFNSIDTAVDRISASKSYNTQHFRLNNSYKKKERKKERKKIVGFAMRYEERMINLYSSAVAWALAALSLSA